MAALVTYLDYNASSPVRPGVEHEVALGLSVGGNPSSTHRAGRLARRHLEDARESLLQIAGCSDMRLVFTSGGTEANNFALVGAEKLGVKKIVHSEMEHPSILASAEKSGLPVESLASTKDGIIDLNHLSTILENDPAGVLVSVMAANNETGVLNPIGEVADLCREHGVLFHTDAVQAFGKPGLDVPINSADLISISAHKIGGPIGIGAVLFRADLHPSAMILGGGQELGYRSGTENVSGAMGFVEAAKQTSEDLESVEKMRRLQRKLESGLRGISDQIIVLGDMVKRLPNTVCFAEEGIAAETAVMSMDLAGFAISAGSACSSGKVAKSKVVSAMGWPDEIAASSVRVSMGWGTDEQDIERFLDAWKTVRAKMLGTSLTRNEEDVISAGKTV